MNTLVRWGKFNLVGAMGIGVQLASLALFNRLTAGHYLYASAAAIELTLLHNFMWHLHYTWRDRRDGATRLRRFTRFHLSNGLVSMLGNLALMRLLVYEARLPLLVSTVMAILCCSVANFCLGNNWAFAEARNRTASRLQLFRQETTLLKLSQTDLRKIQRPENATGFEIASEDRSFGRPRLARTMMPSFGSPVGGIVSELPTTNPQPLQLDIRLRRS